MEFGWQFNVCPIAEWQPSAEVNHEANLADGHSHPEGWASLRSWGLDYYTFLVLCTIMFLLQVNFKNNVLLFFILVLSGNIIAFMLIFFACYC